MNVGSQRIVHQEMSMTPQDPRPYPHADIRVGDAERDAVTAILHDAFGKGQLTSQELDQRLDAALNARTRGELNGLTVDLPGILETPSQPAPRPHSFDYTFPAFVIAVALALWLVIYFTTGHLPVWILIVAGVVIANRRRSRPRHRPDQD
jgi:hypothetical protein